MHHPIFLEYIKAYDIVTSFKTLIEKNLPSANNQTNNYEKFYRRLNELKTIEYDPDSTITSQVINMTSNIDTILNEIKLIVSELIDENLELKYDLLEKDQQLVAKTRPSTGINNELDQIFKDKEIELEEKENLLKIQEDDFIKKIERINNNNLELESIKSIIAKKFFFITFNFYEFIKKIILT